MRGQREKGTRGKTRGGRILDRWDGRSVVRGG